ncbi:MAG: hypothetical protein ACE5EE_11105 [Fidelibacterota bacterium]
MSNTRYLRLLASASYHSNRIHMFEDHLKRYRKRNVVKRAFVNTTSKVKLVSTKIGAIVWVDAGNYAQLIGKQIGDTVLMHNSTFRVAGIY